MIALGEGLRAGSMIALMLLSLFVCDICTFADLIVNIVNAGTFYHVPVKS
jgi:hypothetical protein